MQSDGYYKILASTAVIVDAFAGNVTISCQLKDKGSYLYRKIYQFDSLYRPFISMQTCIKKGDSFRIMIKNDTDAEFTVNNDVDHSVFRVDRIPDYTAGTLPSFGIATPSEYGLVKAARFLCRINTAIQY